MGLSIISAQDLKKLVDSKASRFTVIDARTSKDYQSGHVKGALSLIWHDLCEHPPEFVAEIFRQPGWWGKFFDPNEYDFETKFGARGIGSSDQIVIYGDGIRSKGRDGVIAWLLLYLGAKNVSLLDGGWTEWLAAGNTVSFTKPRSGKAIFKKNVDRERIITSDELGLHLQEKNQSAIWDARTESEYSGFEPDYLPRRGKIPDSKLFDYCSLYKQTDTKFVSKQAYLDLLKQSGYARDINVICYCEMGLRAATLAFMHEVYTGDKVKLLSGGFFLWSHKKDLPVYEKET